MPFPDYETMDEPLLCFILINGGGAYKVEANSTYTPLADFFHLTSKERALQRRDGYSGSQWQNRLQWERQRLINHGYIDGNERGWWKLTADGVRRASSVKSNFFRSEAERRIT